MCQAQQSCDIERIVQREINIKTLIATILGLLVAVAAGVGLVVYGENMHVLDGILVGAMSGGAVFVIASIA